MLEKLAKQTAIYGISTIVVRLLSYLLTPIYTRVFGQAAYGIVTDVYALIPFALVLLSMGMESSYFRFSAKAEAEGGSAEEIRRRKRRKSRRQKQKMLDAKHARSEIKKNRAPVNFDE